jgi:peroxiredoxin/predicted 2-oxoglutarate/Fe(II)-dependent dioxygenase YbiX
MSVATQTRSPVRSMPLTPGEPAPWFTCQSGKRERFVFDTVAGRYIVLAFLGSASDPRAKTMLSALRAGRDRFDDRNLSFFGVSVDPSDKSRQEMETSLPGIRFFWDFDQAISSKYGVLDKDNAYHLMTFVLDPALRVIRTFRNSGRDHVRDLFSFLDTLPPVAPPAMSIQQAPVLVVPRVFEDAFCTKLIDYYTRNGGEDLGFVRDVDGMTMRICDPAHKKRGDRPIEDAVLVHQCMQRIRDRLAPEIHKAFQVRVTAIERYVIACYEPGGHFRAHRDNTTRGTAHRQFAVSLFLNTTDYRGGFLRFPEYGSSLYSAPRGGAVVFSCSLLHEATPVTHGSRYMFLPFLYDDASREVRDANLQFVDASLLG